MIDNPTDILINSSDKFRPIEQASLPRESPEETSVSLIDDLSALIGARNVIGPDGDVEPYVVDWRGRYHGRADAVVKPGSPEEVAAVVRYCAENKIALVPQGGNTGMCGAATPMEEGRKAIVLRLDRLNRIRSISPLGDSISVDAGCILQTVQQAAEEAGRLFPLSLGAEGSCQIGGNLSTNAGGTAVLRYGTMRELCLGLEVVLPDGTLLDGMTALRKDSTGIDTKQLFLGAEGTLGIITGAVLKLFPRPRKRAVALAMAPSIEAVCSLLAIARGAIGDRISSFEAMSKPQVEIIKKHVPDVGIPFELTLPWYALIELSDTLESTDLDGALEALLGEGLEKGLIEDAILASSEAQAESLWRIRHSVSEAGKKEGYVVSHDSAVPLAAVADFVTRAEERIASVDAEALVVMHGHIGDGNMHVLGIINRDGTDSAENVKKRAAAISLAVDDVTMELGGAISAEHGIGITNRERLGRVANPAEIALMRRIKALMDPLDIMNPGKVLPVA
ncbi:FAD-binding oxidoreductase [Acetobacteraceae bacterium H6797]|nr:FAD-binding oxidoreductase [Acetobacteraceae bacterium H6797]